MVQKGKSFYSKIADNMMINKPVNALIIRPQLVLPLKSPTAIIMHNIHPITPSIVFITELLKIQIIIPGIATNPKVNAAQENTTIPIVGEGYLN